MENGAIKTKSLSFSKYSGLIIASVIIVVAFLVPSIPKWVSFVAIYPLITSIVDIVLDARH